MGERIPIFQGGQAGLNTDLPPHELPPEFFTAGQNVRFQDGEIIFSGGYELAYSGGSIVPYYVHFVPSVVGNFWVYLGLAKAYSVAGVTHTDITRTVGGDYTGAAADRWHGTILNGIPIFNNGKDVPQMLTPVLATTDLANLSNWPASTTAKILRAFKNYLVALDVTESGTRYPYLVRWSTPADPGAVPSSWDYTLATNESGRTTLGVEGGALIDCLRLGDYNVIYHETAISLMQFIGGQFVWRFPMVVHEAGLLCARAVGLIPKMKQHFLVSQDDVLIFNGQDVESVVDRKVRKWLFNNLDVTNYQNSYTVTNGREREMWFCFPSTGSTYPNLALTWSWKDGTVGVRDLPGLAFINRGVVDDTTDSTWDGDSGTWDSDTSLWDEAASQVTRDLLGCVPSATVFHKMDQSQSANGADITSYVERQGLALIGRDRQGQPKVDIQRRKLVSEVWIRATGAPFQVSVGKQERQGAAVEYLETKTFDPATDRKIDCHVEGQLIAIKFSRTSQAETRIQGYDMNIAPGGRY